MSPNTERAYRLTLREAGLLDGAPDDLPELVALRATIEAAKPAKKLAQQLWDPIANAVRQAYIFVLVLAYSRHQFAKLVFDQRIETWLALHVEA